VLISSRVFVRQIPMPRALTSMRGADAAGALAMVEAWTGPLSVATLVQLTSR